MKVKKNHFEEWKKTGTHRLTVPTSLQSLYLTCTFFAKNDLLTYANACAFGFLFSFIPIVMLILVVLVRILHTSPDMFANIINASPVFDSIINLNSLADSLSQTKAITNFEIILGISIVFMSRRFFSTVMNSMKRIFNQEVPVHTISAQVLIIAGEAIIIIFIATFVASITTFKTIFHLSIFDELERQYPALMRTFNNKIVSVLPNVFIFLIVTVCYKEESRTKPPLINCIVFAFLCTLTFWAFQKLMGLFINVNRYNFVYGVLSNVIVVLMEVFFFFTFFLFFAQWLFVHQFFDKLLLAELYTLPSRDDTRISSTIKRCLFIKPVALLEKQTHVIKCSKGTSIYSVGETGKDCFYVAKGTVQLTRPNYIAFYDEGSFFGEQASILNEIRTENAMAYTDIEIVRIPEDLFFSLIELNPKVNQKALAQISNYFAKFYGRTNDYPL